MFDAKKNKFYDLFYSSITEDIACIIEIDNEKGTYHVSEGNEYFEAIFKKDGSLRELYCILFSCCEQQSDESKNDYEKFIDEDVFKKDKYQATIRFKLKEVKNYFFAF